MANLGAILDSVTGQLDENVLRLMQQYGIPPSLMDKVLDRIQSHMRQMKAEEYAQELTQLQMNTEIVRETTAAQEPTPEPHEGTVEEFKEAVGIKTGGKEEKNGTNVQRKAGKQG